MLEYKHSWIMVGASRWSRLVGDRYIDALRPRPPIIKHDVVECYHIVKDALHAFQPTSWVYVRSGKKRSIEQPTPALNEIKVPKQTQTLIELGRWYAKEHD